MSLRIAWAGPWNERSAIATFGIPVVAALARAGHQVDILRTETGDFLRISEPVLPPGGHGTVHILSEDTPERIRASYDIVIANVGNHFGFHGALMAFHDKLSPIVIFHDFFLGDFCAGWADQFPDPELRLRAIVHAIYGAASMPEDKPFWLSRGEMTQLRPMIDLFTSGAVGAVVHADHYLDHVRRRCPGPVTKIPLSYSDLGVPPVRDGDRLVVGTVGDINSNKQAAEVIAGIGASADLRDRCDYLLIGNIDTHQRQHLAALAQTHGVRSITFTGWVDDQRLRTLLGGVDVICCLRFPILEGGSASLIMAMLAGRPVLVSDHGCYGEVPDDCVMKCCPGAEAGDVTRHLTALLADRTLGRCIGARARAYAADVHSPARYARDLLGLIGQSLAVAPALRTGYSFGHLLASFGLDSDDPAAQRVARILTNLLIPPDSAMASRQEHPYP